MHTAGENTVLPAVPRPFLLLPPTPQVNWEKYKKALKLVAFNTFVIGPFFNLITYPLVYWRGNQCGYELPTFAATIFHFFMFLVVEEVLFYYAHRWVCHPLGGWVGGVGGGAK